MVCVASDLIVTRYLFELRQNLTAYDAVYIALAEALACRLVTADRRLSRAPGARCPVRWIAPQPIA